MNDIKFDLSSLIEPLLSWYASARRALPWRENTDPYRVWLSEIMLQQTRIEAVIPYYARFLAACPTIRQLAEMEDDRLMKLWEGLGYYSRARNLKRAAIAILEQYDGHLPASYEELLLLPGIGEYTAGAIASIAYGLPEPAVDGNVLRVITRVTGDVRDIAKQSTKASVRAALKAIYPSGSSASELTQAIMELGEQLCLPGGTPRCEECPLGAFCRARAEHMTDRIPVKSPSRARKIQQRTILLLLREDGAVALRRRPEKGLLAGLWEFPGLEGHMPEAELATYLEEQGITVKRMTRLSDAEHIFTHIEWHMQGYLIHCHAAADAPFVFAGAAELEHQYALPTAFSAFRRALFDFYSTCP